MRYVPGVTVGTMSTSKLLVLALSFLAVSACIKKPGSDRHRVPVSGTTPVTTDERSAFIARAEKFGCKHEPTATGEDSVMCYQEIGQPKFVWLKQGGMACGVAPGHEKNCEVVWAKLNAP